VEHWDKEVDIQSLVCMCVCVCVCVCMCVSKYNSWSMGTKKSTYRPWYLFSTVREREREERERERERKRGGENILSYWEHILSYWERTLSYWERILSSRRVHTHKHVRAHTQVVMPTKRVLHPGLRILRGVRIYEEENTLYI
jgi:hypothetical protein